MHRRLQNWCIALSVVLVCSIAVLAQNSGTSGKSTSAENGAATSGWHVPKTAWGEPDFSGMWEPKMPPSAREYAGYSFISHKEVVPLMTAWGKQQYLRRNPHGALSQ